MVIKGLTNHGIRKMHVHLVHSPDFLILANLHVGWFHGLPKSSILVKKARFWRSKVRRYLFSGRHGTTKPFPPTALRLFLRCQCPFFKRESMHSAVRSGCRVVNDGWMWMCFATLVMAVNPIPSVWNFRQTRKQCLSLNPFEHFG